VSQKKSEAPYHKGPARHAVALQPPGALSITDSRVRMLERLGTIERAYVLYGEVALLRPTPAGPDECPPTCEWCSGRRVA
jgi:hypothetical protein